MFRSIRTINEREPYLLLISGVYGIDRCLHADNNNAIQPQTFGDAIDVPFISTPLFSVQFGTDVIAPPGPQTETPGAPLLAGPRDVHEYDDPDSIALINARIIAEPVSIVPRRLSPITIDTSCAPGATPFRSGSLGKFAAAIDATCVPNKPNKSQNKNLLPILTIEKNNTIKSSANNESGSTIVVVSTSPAPVASIISIIFGCPSLVTVKPGAPGSIPESKIAIRTERPSYDGYFVKNIDACVSRFDQTKYFYYRFPVLLVLSMFACFCAKLNQSVNQIDRCENIDQEV
ncbi:hypothetical protein DERP_008497 [Dermatophagoides pteronyssinus]|uniref:Uncharacterized protein n=1 Tax=Dermatophagoides pteronyssinus TaxID=6956 RepID=A0ABQ8IVG8_DERPT|nr:hypothetical protein DERP_008497 [Dermatophagoides pteronyssinus]